MNNLRLDLIILEFNFFSSSWGVQFGFLILKNINPFQSFQSVGYNVGWHLLFHNWCEAIKWPFLFPVPKNATKMCLCVFIFLCVCCVRGCVCVCVCVCVSVWKFSPMLKIMDSFFYLSKFKLRQMKLVICISQRFPT